MRFRSQAHRFRSAQTAQMLARCVHEVESRTEAEVVLVIRPESGSYRDADYLTGALLAFGTLLFKLFSPFEFDPLSIPLPILLAFFLGARLSQVARRYGPRHFLTRRSRRERQTWNAAVACYFEKKVDRVPGACGILLYFSSLEQRAEIFAGERARQAIAPKLEEFRAQLERACLEAAHADAVPLLAEFLRTFGVYLGRVMPCGSEGHINILDDLPDLATERPRA